MSKYKSLGFSAVGAVVMLLAIAAIGLGGWYVWQKNKTTPAVQPKAQTNNQTNRQADPSEAGKYLVIKEWGVRFALPENLRGDVRYGLETSSSGPGGTQTAWLEVGKIASLPGSNCKLTDTRVPGETGKTGGIGTYILRTSSPVSPEQAKLLYAPATNIKMGNLWYSGGYDKDADSCVTSESYRQLAGDTGRSLTYSLAQLEQVNNQ